MGLVAIELFILGVAIYVTVLYVDCVSANSRADEGSGSSS